MIRVCGSEMLRDSGPGVRFEVTLAGQSASGFVVRYRGQVHGFLNRCAHVAMELDWLPGEFFDADGEYLICASHGALYEPAGGACVGGPCLGRGGLQTLKVLELDGHVWWIPGDPVTASPAQVCPDSES
jgi:nitrite reductase/ring-hydroxylating ferredoxin subunit